MKKLLSIAVCASAVAAFGASVEVPLGNVGVTAITSDLTNTIVAVSYKELGDGDGNVTISNIVKTANLTEGDLLHVFKDNSTYETYTLTQGSGGALYWDKTANYVLDANGSLSAGSTSEASVANLPAGVGLWLVRNVAKWNGNAFTFYIYGKPVATPETVPVAANTAALIGNPTQSAKAPTLSAATNGDRILVPNKNIMTGMKTYKYSTAGGWTTVNMVNGVRTRESGLPSIEPGKGFWYIPMAASTVSWSNN